MLPGPLRMRDSNEFRQTVRAGVRAGRPALVVYAEATAEPQVHVGFVVSKSVGNAVTRNRVERRLRHAVTGLLSETPTGTHVVVRALPAAVETKELSQELGRAWSAAIRKLRLRL